MPAIAAIDVGSNAIRFFIAEVDAQRSLRTVENIREPLRLGQDVFASGSITDPTLERAVEAFQKFRQLLDRYGVKIYRAVATSATREAFNQDIFIDRILQTSNIEVQVITGTEEARLIHRAVAEKVDLKKKRAVLVDVGGGSVEVTIVQDNEIRSTESFNLGAVRILQMVEDKVPSNKKTLTLMREHVETIHRRLKKELDGEAVDLCVATGGNIEALGDLRHELLKEPENTMIGLEELEKLIKQISSLSQEERIERLGLRPDRADVILPASLLYLKVARVANVDAIVIPHVGLKDGVIADIVDELYGDAKQIQRSQAVTSAVQLGRKYGFDEPHARIVADLALQIFDQTKELHGLDEGARLILEVGSLLHDIGQFVDMTGHHKHSHYLISASRFIGLSERQVQLVANISRYHRKSSPKLEHEPYRVLAQRDRILVAKLAGILRLADALDHEHLQKIEKVKVEFKKNRVLLLPRGDGDFLLEKWSLNRKSDLFEQTFGVKVGMEE